MDRDKIIKLIESFKCFLREFKIGLVVGMNDKIFNKMIDEYIKQLEEQMKK